MLKSFALFCGLFSILCASSQAGVYFRPTRTCALDLSDQERAQYSLPRSLGTTMQPRGATEASILVLLTDAMAVEPLFRKGSYKLFIMPTGLMLVGHEFGEHVRKMIMEWKEGNEPPSLSGLKVFGKPSDLSGLNRYKNFVVAVQHGAYVYGYDTVQGSFFGEVYERREVFGIDPKKDAPRVEGADGFSWFRYTEVRGGYPRTEAERRAFDHEVDLDRHRSPGQRAKLSED